MSQDHEVEMQQCEQPKYVQLHPVMLAVRLFGHWNYGLHSYSPLKEKEGSTVKHFPLTWDIMNLTLSWQVVIDFNTHIMKSYEKQRVQAGLVLCQGNILEKHSPNWNHTNQTQNSHLKWCISWGSEDWESHPIQCTTTPLVDIRACRVNMLCIYSIHTFLYNTFIYI